MAEAIGKQWLTGFCRTRSHPLSGAFSGGEPDIRFAGKGSVERASRDRIHFATERA
jgi:hypothetical protein